MNTDEIRNAVRNALHTVAPEADLDALAPGADLREALDLDSMDFLNLVVAVHRALGVEIPEGDYARVASLDAMVAYITAHRASPAA